MKKDLIYFIFIVVFFHFFIHYDVNQFETSKHRLNNIISNIISSNITLREYLNYYSYREKKFIVNKLDLKHFIIKDTDSKFTFNNLINMKYDLALLGNQIQYKIVNKDIFSKNTNIFDQYIKDTGLCVLLKKNKNKYLEGFYIINNSGSFYGKYDKKTNKKYIYFFGDEQKEIEL
jgi:hypothetical protein